MTWVVPLRRIQSDYLVYIPFVNNVELVDLAVASVAEHKANLVVIDQSDDGVGDRWNGVAIHRMRPRLSFTGMMNWAQDLGTREQVRYLCFMHNDAECVGNAATKTLEYARRQDDGTLGAVFTNYDAFAVFALRALAKVGPWDEGFPWYVSDLDYYRRIRLAGLRIEDCPGAIVNHRHSQTFAAIDDLAQTWLHNQNKAAYWRYEQKWGGQPGAETFSTPWNGQPAS